MEAVQERLFEPYLDERSGARSRVETDVTRYGGPQHDVLTPLMMEVASGDAVLVEQLVGRGARVDARRVATGSARTRRCPS